MTPWSWYAGHPGEHSYDIAEGYTREECIANAIRELGPGDVFRIVEARMSEAMKHEGSDCVPFLRTRNEETITVGPREVK